MDPLSMKFNDKNICQYKNSNTLTRLYDESITEKNIRR